MGFPGRERKKVLEVSDNAGFFCRSQVGLELVLPRLAEEQIWVKKGEGVRKKTLENSGLFCSPTFGHLPPTLGSA